MGTYKPKFKPWSLWAIGNLPGPRFIHLENGMNFLMWLIWLSLGLITVGGGTRLACSFGVPRSWAGSWAEAKGYCSSEAMCVSCSLQTHMARAQGHWGAAGGLPWESEDLPWPNTHEVGREPCTLNSRACGKGWVSLQLRGASTTPGPRPRENRDSRGLRMAVQGEPADP